MAVISSTEDTLVVRIVYDGPPMAGKTTSLRTLACKLGSSVRTPAEIDGRTIYFDWMDYTGGLFEGRRIHCQIVSVPGQAALASRRRALLETADAVVFVSDTTRDAIVQGRSYLKAARAALDAQPGPAVGVVLQANKRDHADAVPLGELRFALDAPDEKVAIVESIATDGSGIREAFVFAVRLALDRVRELMRYSRLETMQPPIDSAEELLQDFECRERGKLELAVLSGLRHTQLSIRTETTTQADAESQPPTVPRADSPSMIWPPVAGRLILHEATLQPRSLHRQANGDWCYVDERGWKIQSPAQGRFTDLAAARSAMLEWARAHVAHAAILDGRRCIALADDGVGSYCLWQCVLASENLHDRIEQALSCDSTTAVETLLEATRALVRARTEWQADCMLPVRIGTITITPQGPRHAGLMPYPCTADRSRASEDLPTFLRTEFAGLRDRLFDLRQELAAGLARRSELSCRTSPERDSAASLIDVLDQL